ncbi:MAG: hypothetical protein FJZ16_09500 [Candidatus Omnitrophica bacterium]|nr:hypothetical protein [Candidatus Omnitrophota bacterium]
MANRVSKFRQDLTKYVGSQFNLRGDSKYRGDGRSNRFKNNKSISVTERTEIPAYLIRTKQKLKSQEWLKKLHSTIHATIFRSLRYKMLKGLAEPEKQDPKNLPLIQVFRDSVGGIRLNTEFTDGKFKHYRPEYEKAVSHGKIKETFQESYLNLNKGQKDIKLFDIALTKKEYIDIVNKIKLDLKKINSPFSFKELCNTYMFSYLPEDKAKIEIFYKLTKLQTQSREQYDQIKETSPQTLGEHIFYLELSKFLTNKLVRKTLTYLEMQKKKNNAK